LIHRPIVRGQARIWLSFSPDLKHWGDHRTLIKTRHAYWDCHRVGLACQPIETAAISVNISFSLLKKLEFMKGRAVKVCAKAGIGRKSGQKKRVFLQIFNKSAL